MYSLLRPALFALDAERAHDVTLGALSALGRMLGPSHPRTGRAVSICGLQFENPVGLAAGLDKDATAVSGFARLGFGHLEVGTVTPRPQPGNPKPRVFRLTDDQALINRFGFNNQGIDALVARLRDHTYQGVLGVNIGKNKDTENAQAASDYVACLVKAAPVADYVTVNLSSPNTPGLRALADPEHILSVLGPVLAARETLQNRRGSPLPVWVKLAPDFEDAVLVEVLEQLVQVGADAVILTNTTLTRDGLKSRAREEAGGLSGAPLASRAEACLRLAVATLGDRLPVVSVGGVMSSADCARRLQAGARLVQLYTGLIYRGPFLVKECIDASL